LQLELLGKTPDIFVAIMKTTDALVLDEPKTHEPTAEALIEPAIESRPRGAVGVKDAKIYIDGKFYSESDAKISIFDHGLLYGDGIFEGIRFYNGLVFRLEEHLARLWDSARSICLEIPMSMRDMTEALLETIRQNHLRDGYIRLLVTRGIGNLGLNPTQCKYPSVIIIAATIALYHESFYRKGLSIVTCATPQQPGRAESCGQYQLLEQRDARIEANLAARTRRSCSTMRETSPNAPLTTFSSSSAVKFSRRLSRPAHCAELRAALCSRSQRNWASNFGGGHHAS
jgi:hypothetical protein